MKIQERCSCGATFDAKVLNPQHAQVLAAEWRRHHNCPNRKERK